MRAVLERNTGGIRDKGKLTYLFEVFHVSKEADKRISLKDNSAYNIKQAKSTVSLLPVTEEFEEDDSDMD